MMKVNKVNHYLWKDVLSIINGRDYKAVANPDGKYPIYGSGGIMGRSNEFLCPGETVVLGRKGNINNPIFVEEPFWNVDTAFGLVANQKLIQPKYLFYYCQHYDFEKHNLAVTIPSLRKSDLLNIKINLPQLEEQNNVCNILDSIHTLITLKQKQLKEFDALEQSVFYKMFQNDEKILTKKLVDIAEVGSSRRVFASEFVSEGVPFYRGTEISMLSIGQKFRPTLYITSQRYEELIKVKGKPVIGDLLLPSICNDGKIWVVNTDNPFYIKDGRVLWIHPKDKAITDSFYLKYVIKFYLINNFHKLASGTTFAEMKIFNLKKIPVPLPSLSLQKSFAQKIETIEKQKTVVQDEITQLQALLDSEMDKYFG